LPDPGLTAKEKRVLNPNPYRHYRRTYRVAEVRAGMFVLVLLGLVASWVVWMGRHPDPSLFATLVPKDSTVAIPPGGASTAPAAGSGAAPAASASASGAASTLPKNLAPAGWKQGPASAFDANNLYEKIDGRAEYFLSRGFRSLAFATFSKDGAPTTTIDLELYDLGSPENAMSAFNGEKPADVTAKDRDGSTWYTARNALFLARGASYVRAIGSDESSETKVALASLTRVLSSGLAAGERSSAQKLLVDALGAPADKVSFVAENAFSFGFANGVHTAQLPDESDAFLMPARSEGDAAGLAEKFQKAVADYGEPADVNGKTWIKDRYLGAFSHAEAVGPYVVGVRGAPSAEAGAATLAKLLKASAALSQASPKSAGTTPGETKAKKAGAP
jgi:hypothetical protein